jgi:hypothetical protein
MRATAVTAGLALALISACGWGSVAAACPFCTPVVRTFGEELADADVVLFARLIERPGSDPSSEAAVPPATFQVEQILKGEAALGGKTVVEALYVGEAAPGAWFLLASADNPKKLTWTTPVAVNELQRQYIPQLMKLPTSGVERLAYFLPRLEHEDEMLARDAFDEFTKAPYEDVIALEPQMQPDRLTAWILDPTIPATRRRLYFVMLGVCGDGRHAPLLEKLMRSRDRQDLSGLDAMIACYLTLRGPQGLPLVEELYLKNREAEFTDAYSAVMAIRFHGTETDMIPRERLAEALRHLLDRPELADLVIPDLARWEDWEAMDRLIALFKNADESTSWVRTPVVNYLRVCPLPEASERIEELKSIDPDAVRKAYEFFPQTSEAEPVKS